MDGVKHTRGPWNVVHEVEPEDGMPPYCVMTEDGLYIASIHNGVDEEDKQVAHNARLIAAAPALLEALERTPLYHDNECPFVVGNACRCGVQEAQERIEAAITKATDDERLRTLGHKRG